MNEPLKQTPAPPPREDPGELLAQREAALSLRERQFAARQQVERLNAPQEALAYLDCESDQGLERGLRLLALLMKQRQQAPAPRAYAPAAADLSHLTYRERAALYLADPAHYQQAFGGEA